MAAAFNFTPVARYGYRIGVPREGFWREMANSDGSDYGGSGVGNLGGCEAHAIPAHGHPWSIDLTLPPLGAVFLKQPAKREGDSERPDGESESAT